MTGYPLAVSSWGEEELAALHDVIDGGCFTMGPRVQEFEQAFAAAVGSQYAVMSNSGSSANLLAIAAMRYRRRGALHPGDEVIVPAVSWSTTYYPIAQYGLHLRFVDVDLRTLNLDLDRVVEAITPRTRAVMAVNLLGAPNDFDRLQQICDEHDLVLLEDNCESLGATFGGRSAGTFGLAGSYSFFFSHHMSTMEGGMTVTDDPELAQLMVSLRAHGWTRELPDVNHVHDKTGDAFADLFRFVLPGYNLRPLEMEAAVGLVQLRKLPAMLEARRANAVLFQSLIGGRPDVLLQEPVGESSWFGFSMILDGRLRGRRRAVTSHLASQGIECRPVVAGNFVANPVCNLMPHDVAGTLHNAERIDSDGLFVGNHHYPLDAELAQLATALDGLACS